MNAVYVCVIFNPLKLTLMDWIKTLMDWMLRRRAEIQEMNRARVARYADVLLFTVRCPEK